MRLAAQWAGLVALDFDMLHFTPNDAARQLRFRKSPAGRTPTFCAHTGLYPQTAISEILLLSPNGDLRNL
jgi:hypothetical protein